MAACSKCGAPLSEGAAFCGSCGTPVVLGAGAPAAPAGGAATSSGLTSNVAGALAYFTIIPAIIFLVVDPYNRDRFVKFHAFQSVFLALASFGIFIVLGILSVIPIIGWLIGLVLIPLIALGIFVVVVFLMYKAYSNEKFMLPVIGNLAEQQAAK